MNLKWKRTGFLIPKHNGDFCFRYYSGEWPEFVWEKSLYTGQPLLPTSFVKVTVISNTHTFTCTYTHVYTQEHTHIFYSHMYTYRSTHTHEHIYTYMHIGAHTYIHMYTYRSTHTYPFMKYFIEEDENAFYMCVKCQRIKKINKYSVTPEIWFTNNYRKQSNFLLPQGLGGKAKCFLLLAGLPLMESSLRGAGFSL